MEFTDEAVRAALLAFGYSENVQANHPNLAAQIRAALDAAVNEQGIDLNPVKPIPTKWFTDDYVDAAVSKARAEALEEAAAWFEGKGGVIPGASVFARLVSRNNQPCMSGDPRDRLNKFDRREFDETIAYVSERIRALKDKPAKMDGGE